MSSNPITIRNLGPEDAHILDRVRPGTFDNPIDPSRAWAFLATRVNELVVALDMGEVIGFASGTVIMHPDKPTQFFVNEIGVHDDFQRQGIGSRLLSRIADLASDRGCEEIWVLAEAKNKNAVEFYRSRGGRETPKLIMFDWPDLR